MTPPSQEHLTELALQEVAEQRLAVTQRFLSVHRLVSEHGVPKVYGVVEEQSGEDVFYSVYFRPERELSFISMSIRSDQGIWSVYGCPAEARCRVELAIRSTEWTAEQITAAVGLPPTESWNKGDARRKNVASFYHFTGWFINVTGDAPGELGCKLKGLLDHLEPVAQRIRALNGPCTVTVLVGHQGDRDQMSGFLLEPGHWRRLDRLGAALDVDLYASGPALGDSTDGEGWTLLSGS